MADDDSMRRADPDDFTTRVGLAAGRKVFGRYVLEAVAGRGGMGVVWRARDEELEREVALKFLPETVAADPEAVRDLKRETKRCLELTHPHIVRVYDFVQDAPLAAIGMEFVAGQSLAKRKAEAPGGCLTVEELAPLVAQLCVALDYAHGEAKVVHRDLKPANILVTGDGKVKVTDFGIARSLTDTHTRLTGRVGATSGTLAYMSPQQVMGKKATPADDIYALGATLYELLTGKPPFYTGDITHQILQQTPASLAARRAELEVKGGPVPSVWEETILACLAKEPQDRPQSAGEVAARLGLARGEVEGAKAKGENQVGRVDERGRERVETPASRMRWFALVAAAAIVLGVAGYLFWPRGAGPAAASRPAEKSSVTQESSAKPPETVPPVVRPAAALPREFTVTVDPADAGARLWLGPVSDVEVKDGRAVLKDLPDGEQELIVQAPGYQPFTTRVTVKDGRGSVEARLVAVHGTVAVTARPGTQVTAVDEHGRETQLGAVPAGGVLDVENLLNLGRYTLRLEHADCAAVTVPGVELVLGRTAKVAPAQTLLPGELRVFSVPTGAEVRVDGVVAGTTPATIKSQPSEQALRLEVFLRGYRRVEQAVTLQPKEVRSVNVGTLTAENGSLELRLTNAEVRMADLAIRIDGRTVNAGPALAAAPFRLDGLEVGSRTVEIVHPDYEPWRQAVTVRDQEMTAVNVELKPKPGTVACETTPAGARVVINGGERHNITLIDDRTQAERLTPLRVALPPGEYTLHFELKGYKAAARTVSVAANCTVEVSASLEKQVLPGPSQGQTWTVPELNLQMAYIRPGTFTMGSPASESGRSSDEGPQTQVTLTEGYWLGKTEVTQAQWEALMESIPSKFMGPDRPVEQVFWSDAMEFCRKLTERERSAGRLPEGYEYTLPTEAQWEYACRAGTTGQYGGDGNLDDMGWYRQNSGNTTHPVGQKQANAWGLYDMHGNVWEWCLDWYGNYPGGSVRDPTGPASGTGRVGRGGGWGSYAIGCRSAFRSGGVSGYRFNGLGFRLALAPQVNQPATVAANHTAEVSASSEKFRGAEEDQRATEPELDQRFREMAAQYRASPQKPLPDKISRCDVLAKTAILTKDYDRAIDIYEDGLKEMPTWAVGHFNVAILLGNSKSYNSAILHMKMYLELEPNAPDALSAQDQIYIWEQKTSKH
jgi:formylglycine-generating enzyme required for sulfatase activity